MHYVNYKSRSNVNYGSSPVELLYFELSFDWRDVHYVEVGALIRSRMRTKANTSAVTNLLIVR